MGSKAFKNMYFVVFSLNEATTPRKTDEKEQTASIESIDQKKNSVFIALGEVPARCVACLGSLRS